MKEKGSNIFPSLAFLKTVSNLSVPGHPPGNGVINDSIYPPPKYDAFHTIVGINIIENITQPIITECIINPILIIIIIPIMPTTPPPRKYVNFSCEAVITSAHTIINVTKYCLLFNVLSCE